MFLTSVDLDIADELNLGALLRNWSYLHLQLNKQTEKTLLQLIKLEASGKQRSMIIERLHTRYTKLRANRERQEIKIYATTHKQLNKRIIDRTISRSTNSILRRHRV